MLKDSNASAEAVACFEHNLSVMVSDQTQIKESIIKMCSNDLTRMMFEAYIEFQKEIKE
jgi:hypothetical protein